MDKKTPETIKLQLEELKLIYENLQNALSVNGKIKYTNFRH